MNSFTCMVCGKVFPRQMELQRHQTAPTLLHLFSSSFEDGCQVECPQCGLFVSNMQHLKLHKSSCCNKKRKISDTTEDNQTTDAEEPLSSNSTKQARKTTECPVCGKLFPRGMIEYTSSLKLSS